MVRSEVWRDELRLWSDAAATSPASHLARYNLGTIWLERGREDLAERELRAAIHADPTRAAPYKNLGVLYYRQKRFGLAAAHFRVGIRIAPANYDLWMSLSAAEAGSGRNLQALAAARRASSLHPKEARPYYVRGILLERVGDPAGAATAFRKFLDLEKGATARRRAAEEHLRTLQSRLRTPRTEAAHGT
jgi:Flp pilus assembly protein TadD